MHRDDADNTDASSNVERPLVTAAFAQFERLSGRLPALTSPGPEPPLIPGYRLLAEIHRGGQGVVYQAIQLSTQRKVAIKVLREGPFADRVELARFEREIDILSRLDHPHIVAIHDRGLVAGHAYYVMDYVPGRPLDAYVAAADLSVDAIVRLFIKVCDAVNVAHLRGVIHRDLKPGNIRIDDSGEPRVLDFGLAKLAHEVSEASSAQTMTLTGQFVGSLPWTSPEQATGRADLIDLRADVYSLGVLLYQLLTGRFPYPVTGRLDEVARHVELTSPVPLRAIRRDIDHDLELITLSCLAKEPQRRYQSAGELARDLRAYLAGEPVSATSTSAAYRLRKFVRRNRGPVLAGAVISLTLLLAAAVSLAFAVREARQRSAAEDAQRRAEQAEAQAQARADELEQVAAFQEKQLAGIDPRTMGTRIRTGLLEKVRAAGARAQLSPEDIDARIAQLETLLAGSDFTGLALGALEDNFFRPALAAIEDQFADQPLVKARLLQTLASTLMKTGLLDAATEPQAQALDIRRNELGTDHPDTLSSMNNMGTLLIDHGKPTKAEPYFLAVLDAQRRTLGDDHANTLMTVNNLAGLLKVLGRLDEAEPYYREALERRRRALGDEHPNTIMSLNSLGMCLQAQGRFAEAEPCLREALEKFRRVLRNEHVHTLTSINSMGSFLQAQGRLAEAEPFFRESIEACRSVLGNEHPYTLTAINNLGVLLWNRGMTAEAEPYCLEALQKRRRLLGESHPETLISVTTMGLLLRAQGRLNEAEPYYYESMEKHRRVRGENHPNTITAIGNMATLLRAQRRFDEAERYYREALEKYGRTLGDDHPETLKVRGGIGALLLAQERPDEALELLLPAVPAARRSFAKGNEVHLARILTVLGLAQTAVGQFDSAEKYLLEADELLRSAQGVTDQDRSDVSNGLIGLYDAWRSPPPDPPGDATP